MDEAFRITFLFNGDRFEVETVQRVSMRVPEGSSGGGVNGPAVGHFVELRGARGEPLYQRAFSPPRPRGIEYPDEDGKMNWADAPRPMALTVLVPAAEGGSSVALVEAALRVGGDGVAEATLASADAVERWDLVEVNIRDLGENSVERQ
jgi:hypothetical protein